MNSGGGDLIQVTNFGYSANPKWSPDGNWILFESHYNYSGNISQSRLFIVNKLGDQLTLVTDYEAPYGSGDESIFGEWGPVK